MSQPGILDVENTGKLKLLIDERSKPNPERPKLPPDAEERMRQIDAHCASCYRDMEERTHRMRRLAEAVDDHEGIPVLMDEDDHSIVNHIEDLKKKGQVDP